MTTPQPNPKDDLEAVDPRYEVDVQYEVWQGTMMVAASDDLNEARRYDDLYQPCSLLKATTYRQPVGLPDAHMDLRPAGVGEAVAWQWRLSKDDAWTEVIPPTTPQHFMARGIEVRPLYATPVHPDAALMERVRTVLEPFSEVLADVGDDEHDLDTYKAMSYQHRRAVAINIGHLRAAAALLSDLKAEAGR